MCVHRGIANCVVNKSDLCATLQERAEGKFTYAAKTIKSVCSHIWLFLFCSLGADFIEAFLQ
jgi:hypothetical protein